MHRHNGNPNTQSKHCQNAQSVQSRLGALKEIAIGIEQTIVDDDTKEFLLHSTRKSLHDVEFFLLPQALRASLPSAAMWFDAAEFQLCSVNETLIHVQDLISRYGPNLRIVP